jgi:hypothetical protein
MQAIEATRSAKIIELAAFRLAKTAKTKDDATGVLPVQYCDAADSAAWYHHEAISEEPCLHS